MVIKTSKLSDGPARLQEWVSPTGRRLTPGTKFKVKGKKGTWVFIAFVDHPVEPYVECCDAGTATKSPKSGVRCIRPESVFGVSNRKGGQE